eukprot:TRINITY_DN108025_c0_g1_i1.p1 TRINITY_DN108025_c0_g1~~TRINITY_DN108025_c0_g1_i1.p1  ORF type:complete len:120 (-),score=6.69 TRINITY_DN108025_c0_g1_i1:53-412(-)
MTCSFATASFAEMLSWLIRGSSACGLAQEWDSVVGPPSRWSSFLFAPSMAKDAPLRCQADGCSFFASCSGYCSICFKRCSGGIQDASSPNWSVLVKKDVFEGDVEPHVVVFPSCCVVLG